MKASLDKAREELKRADHLIFVSLKYTRTVDIIKNIISRLINTYDYGMESLFRLAKGKKLISSAPTAAVARAEKIKELYADDPHIPDFINLYILFRKINNAKFNRAQEYRRHVTMTAFLDDSEVEINIDIITEYFQKTTEFIDYCESLLKDKND
jgi:hypothetical protein